MGNFEGNVLNVSPLCQGCYLMRFAHEKGFDNHQCDECKAAAEKCMDAEQLSNTHYGNRFKE